MAAAIEISENTAFRISSPNDNAAGFTGDYTFVSLHRGKPIFGILCMTIDLVWYHAQQLTNR